MTPRVLVVAGAASGVGKTTITLGLLEAYRRRGLRIQAFKVGPDFIDPGFHALVTGRPAYNLDGWMCGREHALATVARHAADADLALVEGVMGCFDGSDGVGEDGSTAQVAKWLGAPVVLVIDASSQARSAAAVVQGFERFDPGLDVTAVIANRVAGPAHAAMVVQAIRASCRAVPVGALPRDDDLAIPERHLGLVTAAEGPLTPERRRRLGDVVEASVDLDTLLARARPLSSAGLREQAPGGGFGGGSAPSGGKSIGGRRGPLRVRIGVAHDLAFQFYYAENLDRLRAAGAELVMWSPLADTSLPDVDGLYLGGGYPEVQARRLAANAAVLKAVGEFAAAGRPIYAECGGLMYLAESLEDLEGVPHGMVGLLPTRIRMRPRRLTLDYTEVRLTADTPLGPAGVIARGHEFHCSTMDPVPAEVARAWWPGRLRGGQGAEGYLIGRTLMSYVHLHFGSNPALAAHFVEACAAARRG